MGRGARGGSAGAAARDSAFGPPQKEENEMSELERAGLSALAPAFAADPRPTVDPP